jgi:bacillopeptidase F (M6 metalloprotease family)
MSKLLFILFLGTALHLTAAAQDNSSYASTKESRKEKKMSKGTSTQKDRNYWQDQRNVKKFKKTAKKKNCDCPGEMTAKQRRKHRIR